MQQIWEQHPEISVAQAALEVARAQAEAAGQPLYNPELELDVEKTDINAFSVGINQALDWGDKRGAQQNIGNAEIGLAQAELAQVRQQLGVEVLRSLAQYRTTLNLLELAKRRAKFTGRLVETTEQRFAAGDIGQLDVALARVAHSQARMQVAKFAAQTAIRRAALAAVGAASSQWPRLPGQAPSPPESLARDALLAKLPALRVAQAQVQIAKSATGLARANRSTTPTLGVRGGREDRETLLGLSLSVPLMVRNRFAAEVTAASQHAVQQEQRLLAKYRRAAARLDGNLAAYRLTFNAWRHWKKTDEASLNQQLQLLQHIWKSGEISTSEYLLQAEQNVDAQEAAVELEGDMWITWMDWLDASGQLEAWIAQVH
jgi:cobalt-zinc-cadmium efflux system outer membrane protein